MKSIFIIKYGNYEPQEVHSIYAIRELAEYALSKLTGGMWNISEEFMFEKKTEIESYFND